MQKILKRLLCFILVVIISFTPVVTDYMHTTTIVYADTKKSVIFKELFPWVLKTIGYISTNPYEGLAQLINRITSLPDLKDAYFYTGTDGETYMNIDIMADGSYKISSDFMGAVKKTVEEYLAESPDFVMIPTTKKSNIMPSYFCSGNFYTFVTKRITDINTVYIPDVGGGACGGVNIFNLDDTILFAQPGALGDRVGNYHQDGFFTDSTGIPRFLGWVCALDKKNVKQKDLVYEWVNYCEPEPEIKEYTTNHIMINTSTDYIEWFKPSRYNFYTKDGKPLYLFKDGDTAMNYVYGKASIYKCTPTWEEGQDLVIDSFSPEAYQQMVDAIIAGITEALGTGGGLTPEDIQRIIDAIIGIGGTVGEGTEEQKKANSWLEKIYNKLCDIKTGTSDALLNKLDDIESQLKQIKVLLGLELIWDVITDLIDRVNSVANALVTRFPFSIPWDIKLLYDFCAHTPETPRFEIPVNINLPFFSYQSVIEIDIGKYKAFDVLHKISRGFLTLWFIAVLLSYTRKIVQGLFSQ